MPYGLPPAYLGFTGVAQFRFPSDSATSGGTSVTTRQVRALSADLNLRQDIERPANGKSPDWPYAGRYYDKQIFQVKPEIIEGSISYVAVASKQTDPTARLWNRAVQRNIYERLSPLSVRLKYSNTNSDFIYDGCYISSLNWSARAEEGIQISATLYGSDRSPSRVTRLESPNLRALTWNNVVVKLSGQFGTVSGSYIREFSVSVENNLKRFFTTGSRVLKVRDITAGRRDITGTIKIMGRHEKLAEHARNNPWRCQEDAEIRFGQQYVCEDVFGDTTSIGGGKSVSVSGSFLPKLPNVGFFVEELSLVNDIFETNVNWFSLPADSDLTVDD